jgi:uncharacterized protein YbjT (DUF2867 family)
MQITVFGATGRIGTHVVRQALEAGHKVVAVVRDPARLDVAATPALRVHAAAVLEPDSVTPAVDGSDAVVSALGPHGRGPTTVCSDGTRAELAAMAATGVRRLVVVSANGAYVDAGDNLLNRLVVKPLLGRLLREGFIDTRRSDEQVRASDTDWTIVRPPRLTDGAHRPYRTALDRNIGITIARTDVAAAILAALADDATIGHTLGVGY